jgi:hypothetical protein
MIVLLGYAPTERERPGCGAACPKVVQLGNHKARETLSRLLCFPIVSQRQSSNQERLIGGTELSLKPAGLTIFQLTKGTATIIEGIRVLYVRAGAILAPSKI